jgi:L-seryl-tRNA(Ser) seleniumtransferase
MMPELKQELLRKIPSITELLNSARAAEWQETHPQSLVAHCLKETVADLRRQVLEDKAGRCGTWHLTADSILERAGERLRAVTTPHLRRAINATGIILHTGLGRAVYPGSVVDSVVSEMKGYSTLAIDRNTGQRIERDELVEYLLTELTGAEAATVVCNNAAGTMLTLAALAANKEVIVSRGQLIEIGGSFRLPEVMAQSRARLVEVGATNRTHLKDYRNAITPETAALMRVHPSNYRVIGFTSEVDSAEMAGLAHEKGLIFIDDIGAGALVDLKAFGLPHEPTARECIEAGADVVLFSGDKLIGGSQAGIIVGKKSCIDRLRRHPLMRAVRVDKTCLMILERTLQLFRNPRRLEREHPTYRMMSTPLSVLKERAKRLTELAVAPGLVLAVREAPAYLGSGSLPTEAIPSIAVSVILHDVGASELARRLRLDDAAVFGRIEYDEVRLDMRTITDAEVETIAAALKRIAATVQPACS